MIRLHVQAPLSEGAGVVLSPEQGRYLTAVMRRGVGDAAALFNGRDGEWRATIAEAERRGVAMIIGERLRPQAPGPDLELMAAVVKRTRLETIVEKAAELGCRRVRLVTTRRTHADRVRVERLRAIAVEASEQCGRLDVPEVTEPEPLSKVLDGWNAGRRLMVCDEGEGFDAEAAEVGVAQPALTALAGRAAGPWAVLIGPEGGWASEERARFAATAFVTRVSLGPRILRADTAAISALTLWQASLGDWRQASS